MKRKTQALYARHATLKSHAATQNVQRVRQSIHQLEQRLTRSLEQDLQDCAHIHRNLEQGSSPALLALDVASRLRHQHQAQQLQQDLKRELEALEQAEARQKSARRREKSAQKMGERLDAEHIIDMRRRQQLEQDELVCHVFDMGA